MEQKQRLFIYDRKEMGVLVLLGVMVALFAFTLGVHLGKRVALYKPVSSADHGQAEPGSGTLAPLQTLPDQVPNRQELAEEAKGVEHAAEEILDRRLHEEVARTGIKLDEPKPVELPKAAVSKKGGATTLDGTHSSAAEPSQSPSSGEKPDDELKPAEHPAAGRSAPDRKYTLQVGSYQDLADASARIEEIERHGIEPYLRSVILKNKGKWYRIYLGGYDSIEAADKAGKKLRSQRVIDSYIVSNRIE